MSDKRYQVFVSSTYEDLRKERNQVMQALLKLDCMPAGMELFPAADDDTWTLITGIIDECDYYIVIVGGRYGSTDDDSVGYTEKEYRYALSKGKPIIGFLHGDPGRITADKTEKTDEGKKKLEEFRELIKENKTVKYWTTPDGLGAEVILGMVHLMKTKPAIGWVRADTVPENAGQEILRLQKESKTLRAELEQLRLEGPPGSEELAQGDDIFTLRYRFGDEMGGDHSGIEEISWTELLRLLGPRMFVYIREDDMKLIIEMYLYDIVRTGPPEIKIHRPVVEREDFDTLVIQLMALGITERHQSSREWKLAEYGEHVIVRLKAVRKQPLSLQVEEAFLARTHDGKEIEAYMLIYSSSSIGKPIYLPAHGCSFSLTVPGIVESHLIEINWLRERLDSVHIMDSGQDISIEGPGRFEAIAKALTADVIPGSYKGVVRLSFQCIPDGATQPIQTKEVELTFGIGLGRRSGVGDWKFPNPSTE